MASVHTTRLVGCAEAVASEKRPSLTLAYRPDIDGLRAIAVSAVVLFHSEIGLFHGGFVGVDIFFVISGYLITSIILAGADRDQFSILSFYDRRARRIIPALSLMLLGSSVLAYALLLPTELAIYGKTLLSAALFSANIYFWRTAGYFGADASQNALLHTWSLSVEERFYLLFPVLIVFLLRHKRRFASPLLVLLMVGSLLVAQWQVHIRPAASFYLLPMRAWELLLGAVLALKPLPRLPFGLSAVLGAIGLALICCSMLFLSPVSIFPGYSAIAPCLGAALLIYSGAGPSTPTKMLLSSAPMVFVGRISYAIYLWHWPLFVIPRLYLGRELTLSETFASIGLTVLIATASWKLVETPVRRYRALGAVKTIALCLAVTGVWVIFGSWLLASGGAPWRYPANIVAADRAQLLPKMPPSCFGPEAGDAVDCASGNFDVLVWGDSHAGHYYPAIAHAAALQGMKTQLQMMGGCPPLLEVVPVVVPPKNEVALGKPTKEEPECAAVNANMIKAVQQNRRIKAVVLAGAWAFWSEGSEMGTGEGRFLLAPGMHSYNVAETRRAMAAGLGRTLFALKKRGVRILLMAQVPENRTSPSRCMALSLRQTRDIRDCAPTSTGVMERLAWSRSLLSSDAKAFGGALFDPTELLCGPEHCAITLDGRPFYRDADHITVAGAVALSKYLDRSFFRPSGRFILAGVSQRH